MPGEGQYSVDPNAINEASTEIASSPTPQTVISDQISLVPTQGYYLSEKQKEFTERALAADLSTKLTPVYDRIEAIKQDIAQNKEFQSKQLEENKAEYDRLKEEARQLKGSQEGMTGGAYKTLNIGYDSLMKDINTQKTSLDTLEQQLQDAQKSGDQGKVDALLGRIDDTSGKLKDLMKVNPWDPSEQKYATKSVETRFINPPTYASGYGVGGYHGFGEKGVTARDIMEGTITGGTIGASTPATRAAEAAKQAAASGQATPDITKEYIDTVVTKFEKNPFDASLTQQDRVIASAYKQMENPTSRYTVSGLSQIAQQLIDAGLTKDQSLAIIGSAPKGQGSAAYQAVGTVLAQQEAVRTNLREQILAQPVKTPSIAPPPTVNLGGETGMKKPFISIAAGETVNLKQITETKPAEAGWLTRITDFVSGTPLGSAITGKPVSPESKKIQDFLNVASPAMMVSVPGGAKLPGTEKATSIIDSIFGARTTASIVKGTSAAVIPGVLSVKGTEKPMGSYKSGEAAYTGIIIPTKTPTMKELSQNPAKTGLFSREWFEGQAGKPGEISAARLPGAYGAGGLTRESLLGGGKDVGSYGKFMATYNPEEIKIASKINTPNNETYYVIVGKQGEYQIRNDLFGGERWSADQGENAWSSLMQKNVDPIATILAREKNPDTTVYFGDKASSYKSSDDFNKAIQKNAIDLQNPSEIQAFAAKNIQRSKDMVTLKEAQDQAYQTVLMHRYERETGQKVGSMNLSDYMKTYDKPTVGDTIQTINKAINPLGASATEQTLSTPLISSKYSLPTTKTGILDSNPFPTEPVTDNKQFGTLKQYEGIINASIDNNKPISQNYISDLDKSNLSDSQKTNLKDWIVAYNTTIKEQDSLLNILSDDQHIPNYDQLYSKALDLSKYSPTMAATMYMNVEQREKVDRANAILPELSDPTLSASTRASREKELNLLVGGISDPDLKSKYSALPTEFRTLSGLVTDINTTTPKSVPFEQRDTKIADFNKKVDTQLPDFDQKTRDELKSDYAKVMEQGVIPEKVRALSFGGLISDFTKSYGALKSGNAVEGYEKFQQGVSRYTTRAVMPDITGFSKYVEERDTSQSPIGKGVTFAAGLTESVYTNVRERPVEDVALYFLPLGFKAGEYAVGRVAAGMVKADLPGITAVGRAASTPLAGDVGTLAKVGLGGLYTYQSGQHIFGGEDKSARGYGTRTGDIVYQVGLMGAGTKAVVEMPYIDNPSGGKTFFGKERAFSPLEIARQEMSSRFNALSIPKTQGTGVREAYIKVPGIFRKTRFIEPKPGITETTPAKPFTEPDLSAAMTIGKTRAPVIRAALAEEPHSLLGSIIMESQKTGLKSGELLRTPPHDVDVRVNSPERLDELLAARGETSAGLDVKPFEKNYPPIPGRTAGGVDEGVTITAWGTRLLGEPIPSEPGMKLPYLDEVLIGGKDYQGVLSGEKMNVQMARKAQAVQQDMLPANVKAGNPEARAMSEQFRLPKDWYDFQSISRDLVGGKQASTGTKVGTPTKATESLTGMEKTKFKFDFMPKEDNPIIGAKAGQRFQKELTFEQIKAAYEDAILKERAARKTGRTTGNKEVELEVEKARPSSPGAIRIASSSFTRGVSPGSIATVIRSQITTKSPSGSVKSYAPTSKSALPSPSPSAKSRYTAPSYSGYGISSFSSPSVSSPKISPSIVSSPSPYPSPSPSISPSYVPSSRPSYTPSYQPSYNPSYNVSPYSLALSIPNITIPKPFLGGLPGGGGGGDERRKRKVKYRKIYQPVRTGYELMTGVNMPKFSFGNISGSKPAPKNTGIQKRIKKMYA